MLLTDQREQTEIIVVDPARTYAALIKFRDEIPHLIEEIDAINAEGDAIRKDIASTFPTLGHYIDDENRIVHLSEEEVLNALDLAVEKFEDWSNTVELRSDDMKHLRVLRKTNSFRHVARDNRRYEFMMALRRGKETLSPSPEIRNLVKGIERDVAIAKMAKYEYAVDRDAGFAIARMEDGSFLKELQAALLVATEWRDWLIEIKDEAKTEARFVDERFQAWCSVQRERRTAEAEKKAAAELAKKGESTSVMQPLSEQDRKILKIMGAIVIVVVAVILGWKTGRSM